MKKPEFSPRELELHIFRVTRVLNILPLMILAFVHPDPDLVPPCRLRMLNRWIDIPTPYICTYTYRIFPAGCRRFYEGAQTQAE